MSPRAALRKLSSSGSSPSSSFKQRVNKGYGGYDEWRGEQVARPAPLTDASMFVWQPLANDLGMLRARCGWQLAPTMLGIGHCRGPRNLCCSALSYAGKGAACAKAGCEPALPESISHEPRRSIAGFPSGHAGRGGLTPKALAGRALELPVGRGK